MPVFSSVKKKLCTSEAHRDRSDVTVQFVHTDRSFIIFRVICACAPAAGKVNFLHSGHFTIMNEM